MQRRNLSAHLLFAAFTGLSVIPAVFMAAPLLGYLGATAAFAVGILVLYVAWLAPEPSRALALGALAAVLGALLLLAGAALNLPLLTLFCTALLLALLRSAFLFQRPPLRALAVEVVLVGGGLLFAAFLADGSIWGLGLAFWGFFLVQSLFPLLGGLKERQGEEPREDPFVEARRKALALMEEGI